MKTENIRNFLKILDEYQSSLGMYIFGDDK